MKKFKLSLLCFFSIIVIMSCAYFQAETPNQIDDNIPTETVSNATGINVEKEKLISVKPQIINRYLENPGMGWQYDVNPNSAALPETVSYARRLEIDWAKLNPERDVYNWDILDAKLNIAKSLGKQLSFRIFTMIGAEYGDHVVPSWVLEEGAKIYPDDGPDYSNCVYQERWGEFVEALIQRYDGNDDIAFIDISGYGDFNEWSWQDQTQWDYVWEKAYAAGVASPTSMDNLDSQARRRLADMFIGGSIENHQCHNKKGEISTVSYSYTGFQDMQLVMPYAGIMQSTQYVFLRNPSVGFRHDSLGREKSTKIPQDLGQEIAVIWRQAPVVYELSIPRDLDWRTAQWVLAETHGSFVHNNEYSLGSESLEELLLNVGYRYFLKEAHIQKEVQAGESVYIEMDWQNIGLAPSYPAMGQEFALWVYVENTKGAIIAEDFLRDIDISSWMPAPSSSADAPTNHFSTFFPLPSTANQGVYIVKIAIIEKRTGKPIQLAFEGNDGTGKYFLTEIEVVK